MYDIRANFIKYRSHEKKGISFTFNFSIDPCVRIRCPIYNCLVMKNTKQKINFQ